MEEVGDDFPNGLFIVYEWFLINIASTIPNYRSHVPICHTLINDVF